MRSLRSSVLAACLVAAPVALGAQDVPNRESAVELRTRFVIDLDTLYSKFVQLADAIPAEKYSWRPSEGVRSFGEALMHVASEFYVYTPMAYGATPSPVIARTREAFQKFEANPTKPDVLRHLKESFAYMRSQLMAKDPGALAGKQKLFGQDITIMETTLGMSGDLHEHLGQLIAYARVNGIKPPWTR